MDKKHIHEPRIELSVPNLSLDILDNIKETIETGWISTGGRFISDFEDMITDYTGMRELGGGVKTFQSGTAAEHLSLIALGVKPGDEIIVPTLTFIASVNPIKYVGASPIFMDCDDTLNIDPIKLEQFLENECSFEDGALINNKTGKTIKGIIVVHIFGNPVDIDKLMEIKEKYNLFLIEDAAEAIGSIYKAGKYKDRHCGTIGDVGIYSFNANKIITSASGGAVLSQNKALLDKVNFLGVQAKTDPWRYIHDEVGYNYRMTNISAAFGVSQIKRLEEFIDIKHKNFDQYKTFLEKIPGLTLLSFKEDARPNKWLYSLLIDHDKYGLNREEVMLELENRNIASRPIWGLNHLQKPYKDCQSYKIEKAYYYSDHILNIPCSTKLSNNDIERVCRALEEIHHENIKK